MLNDWKKLKFSKKVLIGLIVFIILITMTYTVIFCIKGSYPVEIYVALIPTCIAELFILYKLELKNRTESLMGLDIPENEIKKVVNNVIVTKPNDENREEDNKDGSEV